VTLIETATGLAPASIFLAAFVTFGAAAIRGLTGFGMAIILVPLLGIVMRPDQAVVLAIILQLLIGPVGMRTILADCDRNSSLMIAGFAMIATPFGLWMLAHTSPDIARLLISIIAIGAFLLVIMPQAQAGAPARAATVATGLMSGILTGFAAMPGPPVIPYYLRGHYPADTARASMMLIFFATAIAGTGASWLAGLITPALLLLALLLFLPMVLGNYLGGIAFGKIAPALWRSVVAGVLALAALSAVARLF
jgi:uncharacterized protein